MLHFTKIYFRESVILRNFAKINFRDSAVLDIFCDLKKWYNKSSDFNCILQLVFIISLQLALNLHMSVTFSGEGEIMNCEKLRLIFENIAYFVIFRELGSMGFFAKTNFCEFGQN